MSADDFVFSTLIARHQDPATASRALSIAEAVALHNGADSIRMDRDAAASGASRDYQRGMTRAIEVLRFLADELNAPASEEKSSREADATPARERRLEQLLDTIRTHGGKWSTGSVQQVRRVTGAPAQRGTARRDLAELHRRGHLQQHGAGDSRYYTLRRSTGGA